uniref:Ig-like domain-containing protein n=1 Tax=Elaeophora elaphi TaxID=1147741 RepID=A0A0R3RRM4_9BILA
MEITEDGNWTNVKTIQNGPTAHSSALDKKDKDTIMSYSTNREKVFHRNAGTIEEIHVLESSGRATRDFAEEHWSSEIKSYVMPQPPKFMQVIKAFRVLSTDTLTLVVEVQSDPPAIFEWFCNDRPVQQNRRKFKARHGINITTLTVEGPEQGVYKCTARNPVGISTTYGYVTVNAPPSYKTWLEQTHEVNEEMNMEVTDKENIETDRPPKFIQQIPNLTLRPGSEAIVDVEVEASPPAKFTWYVNGVQFLDTVGQIEIYYPMANRCIARFPIPQKGEYKVVAENRAGKEHSIEVMYHQTQLPPLPSDYIYHHSSRIESGHHEMPLLQGRGRASSVSRVIDYYEESSYYQRSTSLPRQIDHPYEIKKTTEIIRNCRDEQQRREQQQYLSSRKFAESEKEQLQAKRARYSETAQHLLPHKPLFTNQLPVHVAVGSDEDLVLSVNFKAIPRADVKWSVNGFELKDSKKVTVINEEDHSTLICRSPVRYGRYNVTVSNECGMNTQTTRVHYDEKKQIEQVNESHLLSNEITEHPISGYTTTALFDGWELIDKQQRSSKSADSFETVKYVETVRAATEGRETPTLRDQTPTPGQSFYSSMNAIQQNEESIGVEEVTFPPQSAPPAVPPKPMTPVIHEPLRGVNVSVIPETSHSSAYEEKRYEEITSGISKTIYEPHKLAEQMLCKPLTDMASAEQRYEETIRTENEIMIHKVPPSKPQLQKEIIEKKTFRIPAQRVVEPMPKHPFILKQPEPEICLKVGEKLVLESKVDSSPPSQFKWYQNNFEIRPSPYVIIESPAVNESRATFLKPISGTYKMVASNTHGSCSSTTRVVTEATEEWTIDSSVSVVRTIPEKQEPKFQLVKRSHTGTRNDLPKAPRIVEGFAPVLKIANNEQLVLRVTADAIPEAEFRWMLNNFEVRTSQTVTIQRLAPNVSQVTFHNPISGRYEVVATNSLGQDSCSGKIIIDYAEAQAVPIKPVERPSIPKVPEFIKPLPGETQLYGEEQEFRLSVLVRGEKPIMFRWFADGSLLSNSVEHQMINDLESSTLVVRKQLECDVDYAVEVSNAFGAAWSETTVRPPSSVTSLATSPTSPESSLPEINNMQRSIPHYTIVLMDKDLQQNDEFTTRVAIDEESSPCEFVWMLNGRDIRTIPGFRVESTFYESTLYIKSASSKHSGELSVIASNKYGTARSSAKIIVHPLREESYEFISEVETIPAERPPRIVSPLRTSVFQAGESLELRCRVDGLPKPEVFWTKDGIRISDGVEGKELVTLQYPDGRYELINPKCAPEDAGLYQLTARNIHGTTNTSAYIHVESKGEIQVIHQAASKPRFSKVISNQYEHDIVVSCKVISEAPVVVSWYKNGQRLYQTYKYRMQKLSDNTYTLTICNFDKWDEGPYICRAENTYGTSETGTYIRHTIRTREISEEMLVEENDSEVIGLQDNIGYVKKQYTDSRVKVLIEPEVSGSQEMYSHTAELRKTEEEYKLLVKVAETVASKLVAKVVIDEAIQVALRRMNVEIQSSEEEFESICERQPCPPRFETKIERYSVDVGDAVVLHTDISGYPQPRIEWYFGEQKLEQSEQIEMKYVNAQATLTIKKVEKKHEGTYYCHAENEYGKAVLPCNLCVTDTALEWSESTHKMTRPPMTYTLSETETEVSSNVHVTHAAESYDHYFSSIQPETFTLGYSCLASTSKIHDDSVIITRESVQKMIERKQETTEVILNVNVERTPSVFKHDARILQSVGESVTVSQREPQYTRAEEVIQTRNILLVGDQRVLQQYQSMVNAVTTVVFEKPPQRALYEVTCLYDEKERISKEKIQAIGTVDLKKIEIVNELISTIMATEGTFREAYAAANVDVRRPDAIFDHFITVIDSQHEYLTVHLIAPKLVRNLATCDFHLQQKPESLHTESVYTEYPRRNATAEQRIVILQSSFQKFSEAITWNLKKVSKEATESGITVAHANIRVYKPEEIGEHATTIVDSKRIVPELFAIAAAASKLKLTSVFVTFTKKGDIAHQALVIEYESFVEDEATLNIAMLTAPAFHSKQESVWSYEKKYEKSEETELNVAAVFVDVNATSPNQTIELIASINLPSSAPGIMDVTQSSQSHIEPTSVSWSESSSTGLLQMPKFIKTLENATAVVGEFHQFKCIVSGTPAPVIRWYVDGDIIHDSDVYQTIYEDGVCILKIRELAIEDEGEYTCKATNDAGQAITKCFLQTITEADALKYQQQVILENIPSSNNGRNNNNANDNMMVSLDSISTVNRSHMIRCNGLADEDDNDSGNHRKEFLTVSYEFARIEPMNAETAVVVTRYIAPSKGLHKNLASEERSFNISVFLPNAAMECNFIWPLISYETATLHLILSVQTADFIIRNLLTQQMEKVDLIVSTKKLTFEHISFAICQPWEEILLLKKPENAFVWDSECYPMQKTLVQFFAKSSQFFARNSSENGNSKDEVTENTVVEMIVDPVEGNVTTSSVFRVNPSIWMEGSANNSKKATDENVHHEDERKDESRISIIPEEMICNAKEIDVISSKSEQGQSLFGEYPEISASSLAAIRRYIDELRDFNPDIPPIGISIDTSSNDIQDDIDNLNAKSSQLVNDILKDFINEEKDFIAKEYFNCSFCRKSEYAKTTRDLLIPELTSTNIHVTGNFSSPAISSLNSNRNSKNMVSKKESTESTAAIESYEVDYDLDEDSRQSLGNPGNKECHSKLDTYNNSSTLEMQSRSQLSTETYPFHFTSSMESADAAVTFDATEEFEIFSASPSSRLQHGESYSISVPVKQCNPSSLVKSDDSKSSSVNSATIKASASNTRISSKESPLTHGIATDDLLSRIRVIGEACREIESEIEMKSGDDEEALQIERAIYDISERIEHQQALTEAQAEASEELLKTILEDIIKNTGRSSVRETMAAYKKPVVLLREKLADLEETLKGENEREFRESLMRAIPETQSVLAKSFSVEGEYTESVGESLISVERGICSDLQQIASVNNKREIKRMTPLTSNIKEQLQSLECLLEEVEKEGESDIKELTAETQANFPVYSDAKQHEVHNILMQINSEIGIIKRCCQRNISKTSVDAAISLLHKVRNNVSSMIELISMYRKRLRKKSPIEKGSNIARGRMKASKRSPHHLSPCSKTGFFFKTDASVNFHFAKREESEIINAIVKLFSSSDKSAKKMSKSGNSEISTYDDAVFDDGNETMQEAEIDPLWTLASESVTEKDDNAILSDFVDPQSTAFSLQTSMQDSQAAPVRPPRRRKEMSQDTTGSPPPIPPLRLKRRSKSCDDYKNLIRPCSSDAPNHPCLLLKNMHEVDEAPQSYVCGDDDRSDPLSNINLPDVKESSALIPKQKSKNFSRKDVSCKKIISKVESFCSCSYAWPSNEVYRISFEMLDESTSMQLICEESDYAPESLMHSLLLFEPTTRIEEDTEGALLQTLALLSDLNTSKAESIAEDSVTVAENFTGLKDEEEEKNLTDLKINLELKLAENPRSSTSEDAEYETPPKSQHLHGFSGSKQQELPIANPLEDETNSLHEIESIDDKDEVLDELDDLMVICNPHASVVDSVDLLPTIMEDSENSRIASSSMSVSTNTVIALNISNIDGDDSDATASSTLESKSAGLTGKTVKIPMNPLNGSDADDINYLDMYKKRVILICESDAEQVSEETTININYKKAPNKLKVLAILSPEVQAKAEASTVVGEDFDVLVEQPDEAQDFVVKILDHNISDSISLDLTLPSTIEMDLSLQRSEECEGILSYQIENLIAGETDDERMSITSDYDNHQFSTNGNKERRTGISVNIIARSMHDVARASLEEIPWGEVSMYIVMRPIMTRSITDSETKNSLIQNVTVSESNDTEKRSLRSLESFRSSSQQSVDWNEFGGSGQNLNIPSYVVREGSTATITCEFNNFLTPGSLIDWFKGKTVMQIVPGKTDRISHDLLEVLVISHVSSIDGDIYSIRVNDCIYPVACLIVERADACSEKINDDAHFISPPQTLFVMEGQPSIISCQVSCANQKVEWCKDNKKWVTENERIRLESDYFGHHRIIIDKSELEDQGTYYAFLGDHFTTVTLVVEERIDEREVTVSALGTDTDDDDYREYLVPLGSTATIACELENTDEVQELIWRKDGIRIEFSDDGKVEHVMNGLKHYLVIHDTQADDSASYSICINDIEFKIAHLIVSSYATAIGSKHTKREYGSQVTVEESMVPFGSAATIHCETITQQYSLDWRKNLQPIMQDERIEKKDTADGFEHSLTIYSVRKSDEGEYGVVIKDSYTAVTKITVIESQEQIATEHFDIALHPTASVMNEAYVQLHDRINLQQTQTFEAYQLCNMEEYFDLQFSMQSLEIPVVVDEKRSIAVSYLSREISIQALEKEIHLHREPSYETSEDLTFMEVTIVACNFVTTDVRFEFTSSTSVGHAVAEAIVLTLIVQQSVQIHLSSQCTELRTSFMQPLDSRQLTVVTSIPQKIVEKLGIKLGDRWMKLDVVLLSPMQTMSTNVTNKIRKMIALEMNLLALIFEKCDNAITFNNASEDEYFDAVVLTKSITYPEKIERQFTINVVWLEFIAVYKVPQIFDTIIEIDVARKEIFHLQCKATEASTVDEIFKIYRPIQQQDVAVTFPETLFEATSGNYNDLTSSLEIILTSHTDQNLLTSKKVPLIRMEMISMQLMAPMLEVIPVTYSFSKPTQNESLEMKIFVKPLIHHETSERTFADSVVKLELELLSQIERNFFASANFRVRELDRVSARFFGSIVEYFDVSTAFNIQPKMDEVIAVLPTKAPKTVRKISRLFSAAVVNVISECWSQMPREFYADAIYRTPRIDTCVAGYRASTLENLDVIASFEIQSQAKTATITLLMRAPAKVERSSFIFFDDLTKVEAEFRSQLEHSLEVETEVFIARKDRLIESFKSTKIDEKNIVAIIEIRPEKEGAEFTLLTPLPALIEQINQSFSDTVVNLITELRMQSDFHTDSNIQIARTCALQMYLKASKEANITVLAKFCVQDEIENIMATLQTRALAVFERNERKFSDNLVNFVTELWSEICREAFADADVYIIRNDKIQKQLKASASEDTHALMVLERYCETEELEVTLLQSVRANTYKLNRFFTYKTIDLIATLWFQTQNNFYADINVPIKRKDCNQVHMKASGEECAEMLTSFEVQSQIENAEVVLFTRASTIVEETNRTFSSNLTKIISEMSSTMNRDLYAYFEATILMRETAETWIEAAKEENLSIKTYVEMESLSYHSDATLSIVQKERQLMSVQASSLENIDIYTSFELCPEEERSSTTITSERIIEVTEKRYSDEVTKLEIYFRISTEEVVEAYFVEYKPPLWISSDYKTFDEHWLHLLASQFVEDIINEACEHFMQESEESISIMVELSHNPIIYSSQIDFRNVHQQRRIIEENKMETSWSRVQLNVEHYQHLDLARSSQNSKSTFILHGNIYDEDESTDEISTSSANAAPQFAETLHEFYEINEFATHLFKCIIYGSPVPHVRWYHNEQAIFPNDNVTEIAEDGIYILKINSVDKSWNGRLVCEAENTVGTARTNSIIRVQRSEESSISNISAEGQLPIIQLPLKSKMHVKKEENVQLKCIISGNPLPSVQWRRNDVAIENNEHYSIIYDDGICILHVLNVTEEDNAIFSCMAVNLFGSTKTEIKIIVEDTTSLKEERVSPSRNIMEDNTVDQISPGSMSSQDSFTTQFQIPQFTLPLTDITIRETEELQLKCIVTGEPMPTIRWTCNGTEIQADNRNIFIVYEDGIVILKITKDDKEGLYICEATNGVGSAQTQSFVCIYRPEALLTTTIGTHDIIESAEAIVLSVSTTKFSSTVDISEKTEEGKLRKTFDGEEITIDQHIPLGMMNYLIEAEAVTIRIMSYKLSAHATLREKSKKLKEEKVLKIIIEEDVVRTRTYLRVVERSARQFWTLQGHVIERPPPYWSREVISEKVEFERTFQNDEIHEFLEDKDIIERYVQLLQAKSESIEECKTRFKLRQIEGQPKTLEKRGLEIHEEQTGSLFEDTGVFTVLHCTANAMHHAVEAYVIFITHYRYKATFDIPSATSRMTARDDEFEASIEESVKREKYFSHSILKLPHFIQSFALFEEGFNTGLRCSVYGLPVPYIRISHNGCPILRNNRFFHVLYKSGVVTLYMQRILEGHYVCEAINAAGRAVTECYIRIDEAWNEKQRRKIRRIRIENASRTTKSTERSSQSNENLQTTSQTSTFQFEYEHSKQNNEEMESMENKGYSLMENDMTFQEVLKKDVKEAEKTNKNHKAEKYEEISKEIIVERKPTISITEVSVIESIYGASKHAVSKLPLQEIDVLISVTKTAFIEHAEILNATIHHETVHHETTEARKEEIQLVKERENAAIHVSIQNTASELTHASIASTKEIKKELPTGEIAEKVNKSKENIVKQKPVAEFKDTGTALDLQKYPQHKTIEVLVLSTVSETIQTTVPMTKQAKTGKEIAKERVQKIIQEFGETIALEKNLKHEIVDVSVMITALESDKASI